MNPSSNNWIDKYFSEQGNVLSKHNSYREIYNIARSTGFIYGQTVFVVTKNSINTSDWTSDELSKVALLNTLARIYSFETKDYSSTHFIAKLHDFYKLIYPEKTSLLHKLLPNEKESIVIEKNIATRIQTNNTINKDFFLIFTNAILFVDVLAFRKFLEKGRLPKNYLSKIEKAITDVITIVLQNKTNKSENDDLLVKVFNSSLRKIKLIDSDIENIESLNLDYFTNEIEKNYLMDLANIAMYSPVTSKIDLDFLYQFGAILKLDETVINESFSHVSDFIQKNQNTIPFYNYSNAVKHLYDKSSQTVGLLISRNKKRILTELSYSKELVYLLAKSTHKSLDREDKKKIKKHTLELCKTVPALTIFLLPGGSLLLPILIKLIPQMLPSAFNENLQDD